MRILQTATLTAATITTGVTAGVLAAFAFSVMPGLHGTDDRVFVDTMNRMNAAIINGWFMTAFVGGLLFTAAALLLHLRGSARAALPWIIAGLALYLVMFIITSAINVPLNDKLALAGKPGQTIDLAAARDRFEGPWVVWNVIRTVANTAALGFLGYALIVFGRSTSDAESRPETTHPAIAAPTTWLPPPPSQDVVTAL